MPTPAEAAAAGAVLGGRTARVCDGCMRRRARWHCEADDAFLCQACDVSVHSANPLARRHHRIRLPTSSSPSSPPSPPLDPDAPTWLHGLKRRPRTPRFKPGAKQAVAIVSASSAVPDLEAEESATGDDEHEVNEEEEELLYRVPVFDPMLAELCNTVAEEPKPEQKTLTLMRPAEPSPEFTSASAEADGFSGFDVPDAELIDFAADMESLLTGVMGDGGFDDLGFLDEEKPQINVDLDMEFEPVAPAPTCFGDGAQESEVKKKMSEMILKLDYEAVIASWVRDGSSPWFHGDRPHLDPGEPWQDFPAGSRGIGAAVTPVTGGEREARVSRYREKRRTRLFAKKIRYEVRKLNAEKRPRMKGRFVKRAAFPLLPPPVPVLAQRGHGRFRF